MLSNQCKNDCVNSKNLLIESDLILENLNKIIDSHSHVSDVNKNQTPPTATANETKNFVQNILKKSESFKKLTSFSSKKLPNAQKIDEPHTMSSTNIERILSQKIDSDNSCSHMNVISKRDKFKSKSYFINSTESSSQVMPTNLRRFFFSNSSSSTISGIKTKKLNSPKESPTQQYSSYVNTSKKKRSSLFNLFSFVKNSSNSSQNLNCVSSENSPNVEFYNSVEYDNVFSEPELVIDSPDSKSRPQSEYVSTPDWSRNFKFFNKKSYKVSKSPDKRQKTECSSLISIRSNDSIPDVNITKRRSIRCKGFSIPLNASYCPNSSLKDDENKLSIHLKYAEIKQLDDDFDDENQNEETNRLETYETFEKQNNKHDYESEQGEEEEEQEQGEVDLIEGNNRCCSPSPSILTLSLNNKCSTATKTLNQNLNSINFVDNLNINMFSQQQNQSKTNNSKVMINRKVNDLADEVQMNDVAYRKKRFQQFQTQSLIDLNIQQLAKKNDQCLDSLNNTNSNNANNKIILAGDSSNSSSPPPPTMTTTITTTAKSILNPLFKLNNYQTIEEDQNLKFKQSTLSSLSSSTFVNNEAISDLTIKLTTNSKSISKSIKLRKGVKLRDIIKPVLSESNTNIEDCELYKASEQNETDKSLIDLDQLCDGYLGAGLYLKKKDSFSKSRKLSQIVLNEDMDGEKSNMITHPTFSSINWQNYFGTKSYKNNKHKRNSCIAVMNEYSSSTNQSNTLKNSSTTSITMQTNYPNFVFPSPVATISTATMNSERTIRGTRNFKRMGQIASIFASYSHSKLPEMSTPLNELLNLYTKELPKLPDEFSVLQFDLSILDIESDWNKFVGESYAQSLPIKKAKQQMAIWELFVTECSLIKSIKTVIDVFLNSLINLKQNEHTSELFKDIDIKKLFCNIIDVFNCNVTLWQKYLYPTLNNLIHGNSINLLIDPHFLIHSFSDFKTLFKPYEEYCLEQNNITDYFKKKVNENENFAKFITWAENHPLSGRLKFSEYMIMPVQRITRYHILIENISQFTDDEQKREQFSVIKELVNSLPNTINMKLGYIAQFNDISESIEKYEGIQVQNDEITDILNQFKKFDIKSPLPGCSKTSIRELIHQGPLRLKDMPKSLDVHCFLFTDMLLITQLKKSKKYKIIKPPVSTSRMIVKELTQTDKAFVCISLNDYNVPDSVYMFISNQSKKWIEFLELAKQKYMSEKQKFCETISSENFVDKLLNNLNIEGSETTTDSSTSSRSVSLESTDSTCEKEPEKSGSDSERRSSNTTITDSQTDATVIETVKSPVVQKKVNLIKQTGGTRIIGGRVERPRRNMTDPNQHSSEEKINLTKRNSLNDRPGNMKPSLINQTKLNFFADSTSTILSTDSGVSNCDNNHISFSQESITNKNSPIKIINKIVSPSSPTSSSYSSSSTDPIYSNLSMLSSSSSNCSKYDTIKNFKPQDEDFYEDDDLIENEDEKNTVKNLDSSDLGPSLCDNNFMFKKIPNFRIKQPASENIKLMKANFENLDMEYKSKNETEETSNNENKITIRKPLIRIRPTNLKNEAIRLRSEKYICKSMNSPVSYDSTVDSAQSNNCGNGITLDNHHRMILVNLLHTTLDSTEV